MPPGAESAEFIPWCARRTRALPCAALLLLSACSLGPYYHRPGPGIPDADKPKVTERFFRGDRSCGTPGVGLGLSIVDAVAKLHGGAQQLLDNHPGLRAQMVPPVATT